MTSTEMTAETMGIKMKNTFLLLLVIVIFALSACGGGQAAAPAPEEPPLVVDLTVPAAYFESKDDGLQPGDDLADYIVENDFLDAHWNSDGSLTITMTLLRFESFKENMIKNTEQALVDLVDDDTFPFVLGFEATTEFKIVTILVDRAGFESGGAKSAFLPVLVGVTVGMYRGFVGEDEYYSVIIADAVTGEKIEGMNFPIEEVK